jgi:hypothetical protein
MSTEHPAPQTRAKQIFSKASPEHQELIRDILREEREVINMKRRSDIHTRLYDHIRRIIK